MEKQHIALLPIRTEELIPYLYIFHFFAAAIGEEHFLSLGMASRRQDEECLATPLAPLGQDCLFRLDLLRSKFHLLVLPSERNVRRADGNPAKVRRVLDRKELFVIIVEAIHIVSLFLVAVPVGIFAGLEVRPPICSF